MILIFLANNSVPKSYHNLSALGSCAVFVVFRKISVKQKQHRAQLTFDLEYLLYHLAIFDTFENLLGALQNIHEDLNLQFAHFR